MKKIIAMILVIVTMMFYMTGCGTTVTFSYMDHNGNQVVTEEIHYDSKGNKTIYYYNS